MEKLSASFEIEYIQKDKEKFNNGRGIGNEKAFLKQKGMAPIKVTRTDNVNNG